MASSGFREGPEENNVDVLDKFVTKDYLIDIYPYLTGLGDNLKMAGLWTWGINIYGQLGNNSTTNISSPVQTVCGGTDWKLVSCGYFHTSAIKTNGTLWGWGYNSYGQLGDNSITHKSSPIQTVTGGTDWKLVSCGTYYTSAIKTDGTLWTWGINSYGQLGDSSTTSKSSPVQTVAGGTSWKTVSCGTSHTSAIKTDGTLWTWGLNSSGPLGDNSTTSKSSPVQTVAGGTNWKMVSCGKNFTSAIKTDGTLWTCGYNGYGQLGNNSTTNRSSPVQTVCGGTDWKLVSCGTSHTSAIKTNGTLWGWGNNQYGQLGNGTTTSKSSPVQTVTGGTSWKLVSCGTSHTSAIKTDGTLWTWGANYSGQLGNNSTTNRSSPVQTVTGGTSWKAIAGGKDTTMAISEMGEDF